MFVTYKQKEQDIAAELETLRTQERVEVRKIAREENERKLQTLESQRAANERDFDDAKQQMVTVSKLQSENAKLKQDNDALIARYEKQLKQVRCDDGDDTIRYSMYSRRRKMILLLIYKLN